MRIVSHSLAVAVLIGTSLLPVAATAQGRLMPRPCAPGRPEQPRAVQPPCSPQSSALQRTRSDVRVTLADRVFHYEISESFVNHGAALAEADYLFPLPSGAAFQELQLQIGNEMVSGEVLDAVQARRVYEDIVRRQRDPALVEWMGRGLLRARIFPIAPGETKRVVVRYAVVAQREGDALRVDYDAAGALAAPDVRFPRRAPLPADRSFGSQNTTGDAVNHADASPDDELAGTGSTLVIRLPRSAQLGTPYSPTHRLAVRDRGDWREVTVRGASAGDVTVLLPVNRGNSAAIGVLAHRPTRDEDGFALITVAPPTLRAAATPRDVVFVVDVSGSMRGEKMEQAKAAGRQLLATLDPRDRFRVISFASDVRSLSDSWQAATPTALREARRFIDALEARGSTNISGALTEALDVPAVRGRLPLVLFVTDGEPTVGERQPEVIARDAARLRGGARLFTFGVGSDVNAALLEQLSLEGGGTAQFVRPEEDVERAVSIVASRLTRPLVTDVRVSADGVRLLQPNPGSSTDIFAGQDLVLLTRYSGSGSATVRVEGTTAEGPVRWTTRVQMPARQSENPFVARLWASQRVGWLSAQRRREGPSAELDDEIRALGMRYGLPTELSSYLVLEPGMTAAVGRRDMSAQRADALVLRGSGMRPAGGRAVGAPSPVANETADQAFAAAKMAAEQRAVLALPDLVVTGVQAGTEGSRAGELRHVAGKQFELRDGVWTDMSHAVGSEVIRVKPYGAAYFRLLELAPGLREPFALGERVLVAGRAISVEVAADGAESLDLSTLARFGRDW